MGQKVNPHGARVGVIFNWSTRWYAGKKDFANNLVEDYKLREMLKEKYYATGISHIDIERSANRLTINIFTAKPGMIIGRGGKGIEELKAEVEKFLGHPCNINVMEIKSPDTDAQLVAENIAKQLEGRTAFRRAMKTAIRNTMKYGAKGIKINCSGRLGGAEIARSEHYHEGTIPLQTIRADIDYGFAEADTTYGKIGIKVWIYKGEILNEVNRPGNNQRRNDRRDNRGERRDNRGDRRDNRGRGDRRDNRNNGPRGERRERTPREGGAK